MQRTLLIAWLLVLAALSAGSAALAQEEGAERFAFAVSTINDGLPALESPLRLDTPRAALESFLEAIDQREYAHAAQALNLNAIETEEQASRGPDLTLKLAFLLRRYNLIDWADMPDQPDARVLPNVQKSFSPYSRRSVELGEVDLRGRATPISLQRFHTDDDSEAVWLFLPFVVKRVDAMYSHSPPAV